MDNRSQSDREGRAIPPEDTHAVDDDSDSLQAILYQLLERTTEMESRLDRILAYTEQVQRDLRETNEVASPR